MHTCVSFIGASKGLFVYFLITGTLFFDHAILIEITEHFFKGGLRLKPAYLEKTKANTRKTGKFYKERPQVLTGD